MFKDLPEGQTHCDLVADAKQRALDLYTPPFSYISTTTHHGFLCDKNKLFFCNIVGNGKNEGELIAEALNEYYEKRKEK